MNAQTNSRLIRIPGMINAHSHAFHRVLRGRTHERSAASVSHGTDNFWTWREQMYAAASYLSPQAYEQLATAVFAEMVTCGWTAVGEFHYVHRGLNEPGGTGLSDPLAMEEAIIRAAYAAGIRMTLLDTCYLQGGLSATGKAIPLNEVQTRFSDGTADSWLRRRSQLRERVYQLNAELAPSGGAPLVTLGAAVHSVRAVPRKELERIGAELEPGAVLHAHVSEQPAENEACLAAYGMTPVELLSSAGLLSPTFSAVHATHLTEHDIELLGASQSIVVMCPTTEADLADGIGPARELADAGAVIALGTDQHASIDPYLEMRGLEYGERLATGQRGRFQPAELMEAAVAGGAKSLGMPSYGLNPVTGDYVLVDTESIRTFGSRDDQLPLTATSADVHKVVINDQLVATNGVHATLGSVDELYCAFMTDNPEFQ
ncbi:formimidoylglutamate deiminase [Neomicrococcus lactis]|uniref:Formiminoglutamate deiminase n=1 Tax=Neomicrococcus lactis TaxID=732241 RepID=A0A7W8YAY3_9MICC|nr:formimidoylglutamate deiminase [Neomicrococcus lactis]MBB5598166.1 formiminoglutamate deiminase [Neomicrococcus lactis]